jgi:hypothetical protein
VPGLQLFAFLPAVSVSQAAVFITNKQQSWSAGRIEVVAHRSRIALGPLVIVA